MQFHMLLSVVLLLHITIAKVYNVIPDEGDFMDYNETESAKSLEYYLKNTSKFFSSDSQLHFKMGYHYLNTDLVIQNITNVTLTGEFEGLCIIRCTSHVRIIIFNVTDFRLENITFENCSANYSNYLHDDFKHHYTSIIDFKPSTNASILLYHCVSVRINNIVLIITESNDGFLVVNVRSYSKITNIHIIVQTSSLQTHGILFYYDNWKNPHKNSSEIQLDNFQFTANGSCAHSTYYAITSLLLQNNTNVSVVIQNTIFTNLINVTALYFYGETCGSGMRNYLTIKNCVMSNNTGNPSIRMFHITLSNIRCITFISSPLTPRIQQYVLIKFTDCLFENNSNMTSMIYISPASSQATTGYLYLNRNTFHNNRYAHVLIMKSDTDNIWQLSNFVLINKINVTSSVHDKGKDFMSFTNGWILFYRSIIIMDNGYYTNIFNFHLSIGMFYHNTNIANNTVRQIYSGTFIILRENATINITRNTVYILFNQIRAYSINSEEICTVQFYTKSEVYNISKLLTHVTVSNNLHMIPKFLLNYHYKCRWLSGSSFQKAELQPELVFGKLLQIENNRVISKDKERPIPLSICKCAKANYQPGSEYGSNDHDCYSAHLGKIYPGQTLEVEMITPKQWLYRHSSAIKIVAHNTEEDNCSIVDTFQLSQTHLNHDCNNYSYTLWPKNESITVCKLFIGLQNMPEMFYIEFKPCPLGFTLQEHRKSCYCDPVLSKNKIISIKSCKLSDETILRPACSWISAKRDINTLTNNTTYIISSYCPFQRCLPYQSNLDLSNPDSQCQFKRTGLLCGKCQQGLSTVFGSHQCKHCSNIYLLLIILISLAGLVLVTFLYIFDLTVRSGTINTCMFYVNIININVLILFPNCHSFVCVILSFMNFDFRITSCFYNGMDDYAKEWIKLMFSFYLIIIATVFIILSRYSAKVQRFTAKNALPVLATLFLFSYTKVLTIVCNVLFRYSTVTHLPSNKTELVWSISTTTPLFGVKFLALFIVCMILFLILIPFNLTLLFTRTLSCLKLIANFKPILDTYFGAYKDSAYYWTGLLLLIRAVVYALPAIDEDLSFLLISILLGCLLCLHAAVQPHKSKFCNIQECIAILNLLAVHAVLLYKKNVVGRKIAMALISIGVYYFIIAIVLHCCMYKWNNLIVKGIKWSLFIISKVKKKFVKVKSLQEDNSIKINTLKRRIPDVTYPNMHELQESLLAIEPDK